jgi:4-aminobutyrate aminotransferase-like enzyme
VGGRGIRLIDATGKKYIDASCRAAVSCLVHGHPNVLQAMHAQIDKRVYAHTRFFSTPVAEEWADRHVACASGLGRVGGG